MDLDKVLAQLRAELENLNAAIVSLERLQTEGPRRGRPPKLVAAERKAVTDLRPVTDESTDPSSTS
jgi:hypothetical protein